MGVIIIWAIYMQDITFINIWLIRIIGLVWMSEFYIIWIRLIIISLCSIAPGLCTKHARTFSSVAISICSPSALLTFHFRCFEIFVCCSTCGTGALTMLSLCGLELQSCLFGLANERRYTAEYGAHIFSCECCRRSSPLCCMTHQSNTLI